jgi:spermidine synthase
VRTYHTYIPSFGDWGFLLASDLSFDWSSLKFRLVPGSDAGMRFLTGDVLAKMTLFDPDSSEVPTDIGTLQNPTILKYYMEGVQRWRG